MYEYCILEHFKIFTFKTTKINEHSFFFFNEIIHHTYPLCISIKNVNVIKLMYPLRDSVNALKQWRILSCKFRIWLNARLRDIDK